MNDGHQARADGKPQRPYIETSAAFRRVGDQHNGDQIIEHLAMLRAPLAGLALDDFDHEVLTAIADTDTRTVATISGLLYRVRCAPPLGQPDAVTQQE